MKKGISLIVLVITIIVMIILAAAIIISISNSNVINKAGQAVKDTDLATIKDAATLKYSDVRLNKSLLGGKTVAKYIEDELVDDGTLDTGNPYFFTNRGDVYFIPEYDATTDSKANYRVIDNQLYYFGTDINKRISLKDNTEINTDYIVIDYLNILGDRPALKLSSLIGSNKIKSSKSTVIGNNATIASDITIGTFTELYLQENYGEKLATVIYYDDFVGDGEIDIDDYVISYHLVAWYNYDVEALYTAKNYTEAQKKIMNICLDIDMDNTISKAELLLNFNLIDLINHWGWNTNNANGYWNLAIKDMPFYVYETIEDYVAADWVADGGYDGYLDYVDEVNATNSAKDPTRKILDELYNPNVVITGIPIRVNIFK